MTRAEWSFFLTITRLLAAEAGAAEAVVAEAVEAAGDEEDGPPDEEEESEEEPWVDDASFMTTGNIKSKRVQSSSIWDSMRMLIGDHPKAKEGFTHVCVEENCGTFFTLVKPKGKANFGTTKAIGKAVDCPTSSPLRNSR
jgi:hypothetical protein